MQQYAPLSLSVSLKVPGQQKFVPKVAKLTPFLQYADGRRPVAISDWSRCERSIDMLVCENELTLTWSAKATESSESLTKVRKNDIAQVGWFSLREYEGKAWTLKQKEEMTRSVREGVTNPSSSLAAGRESHEQRSG